MLYGSKEKREENNMITVKLTTGGTLITNKDHVLTSNNFICLDTEETISLESIAKITVDGLAIYTKEVGQC